MPKNGQTPSVVEDLKATLQKLEAAKISTAELDAAGINQRTLQRWKERSEAGDIVDNKWTRDFLAVLKPIAALKIKRAARDAAVRAARLKHIGAGFAWGGAAIAAAAVVHPILDAHGWCQLCLAWMST